MRNEAAIHESRAFLLLEARLLGTRVSELTDFMIQ